MSDTIDRLRSALAEHYAVENEIGSGGMATVYGAEDLKHHRKVAVKVLRPEIASSLGAERFLHEIEVVASLQHPHILPLYDSGHADGFVFFVMPYVDGESLRARLNREHQLPLADALKFTREIAAALSYAHSRNVIHRDIKPENIMLSGETAVLADFGIAKAVSAEEQRRLTETGLAVGTPAYMSPEQGDAEERIDGRSDVYSLGCVLYESLVGNPPYTGITAQAILARKAVDPVPGLRVVREMVSEQLEQAVMTALAKSPADRFASASDFAAALPVLHESSVRVARAGTKAWPGSLARASWYVAAIVILLVGAFMIVRISGTGGSDVTRLTVLPFENKGAADDEYFADGITDEIATRLAGVPGLSIIARQSAVQYKNSDKTAQEIGHELRVDYLLEATVSWQHSAGVPSRVRVRPRLIRTSDASTVWGQVYDEDLTEVFTMQSSIARQVVDTLGIALAGRQQDGIESIPTASIEAYDLYLRGKDYFNRPASAENYHAAERLYSRALALDPRFAAAAAALSLAHSRLYWYYFDRTSQRLAMAQAMADSAASLSPNLRETHIALGELYYYGHLDYGRALAQFKLAGKDRPDDSEILMNIGLIQRRQAKWSDASINIGRALELEPTSATDAVQAAITFFYTRQYARAERPLETALSFSPDQLRPHIWKAFLAIAWKGDTVSARGALEQAERVSPKSLDPQVWLHWGLYRILDDASAAALTRLDHVEMDRAFYHLSRADVLGRMGRHDAILSHYDSARVILEARLSSLPNEPRYHAELGIAYAGLGQQEKAVQEGESAVRLMPVSKDALAGADMVRDLAQIYLMVGMRDEAVDQLEKLLRMPSPLSRNWLRLDPLWSGLRDHPRFKRLIAGSN
ncbi:MAG: protein kinase [Gemmatimonadales bacterium]